MRMDVNMSGWMALNSAMRDKKARRAISRATLKRVWGFARPHRRSLLIFVLLSTITATITVASPVLAGRVVDEIVEGGAIRTVVVLALIIALLAVLDAVVGIAERRKSAGIGEGLILDLRRAVFAHVQRMPLAFFTRTRTGALVSRLNNDVISAQQAFTWTLSSVVSNAIALILTLGVMLRLSWQITVLALIMLPIFYVPARRMGRKLASLEREQADHNSAMTTQMTERFSAPGATLVKLFGRPAHESSEFAGRARRVRRTWRPMPARRAAAPTRSVVALA
jgi:ATP-binding cassette subfamily B protein